MAPNFLRMLVCLFVSYPLFSIQARAQSDQVPSAINGPIDKTQLTALRGNVHKMAQPKFDRGPAPPSLPMQRMLLVLKRSPQQETALRKLLDEQQDRNSANYHNWLTPEQFGVQFGASDQDIQSVLDWLRSYGFQIAKVAKGRSVIELSGTAAQVQEAFQTEIHRYVVNGEEHWANSKDPQIPTALTGIVAGVSTLHNFRKKPQIKIANERISANLAPGPKPQITLQNGQQGLGPGDYGVIYNLAPIIQGPPGVSGPPAGTGTTIAIVGRTNINVQDVARFRAIFNLQNNNPQIFLNGPDPGDLGGTEEAEAVLDATWSGALAPGAETWLIVSASTDTTDGVDLSSLYIIDNSAGTIMTESFGVCEAAVTAAEATNLSQLAEQAAAEGITYIVSAGDTGSAGCDNGDENQATGPFSVNVQASTPFTVAVGGTEFNENGNNALYWNSTNNQYTLASARSYIPEDAWNESCTIAQCGQQKANIAAGGGGVSTLFSKPSWQSGVTGIPNDGMRDVPDVALTAASHDPYLLCLRNSCQPDAQGNFSFFAVSGTSAAAPSFAGIMALVNAAVVPLDSRPRLGQVNYVLYRLAAAQNSSACNGSNTSTLPAASCVFNDVTIGNNAVPGEAAYGTAAAKYQSGAGYDLATGLGSMNVANLVKQWTTVSFNPTTTALSINPTAFMHGAPASVQISVTSASGTPTGDVSLSPGDIFTLDGSGSVSAVANLFPGGYYAVSAHYTGDGNFAPSDSSAVALTVTPEPSTTVATVFALDQTGKFLSFTGGSYGSFVYLRADVVGQSGVGYPTGNINFTDNGINVGGDPYILNSQGNTATLNGLFTSALGPHSIAANYSGDPSFNASSSKAVPFTITQASTTTAVGVGSALGAQFVATVKTNSGGNPPSGTVTFFAGGTQLGSPVPVTGVSAITNPLTGVSQGAQATATINDAQLANGQYTVSAVYSGDIYYVGSSSPPTVLSVKPDYSLAASSNLVTIAAPGGTGNLTLTVNAVNGFNGAVDFSCSGLPSMTSCQFTPASVKGSGSTNLAITTTSPTALLGTDGASRAFDGWIGGTVALAAVFLFCKVPRQRLRGRTLCFMVLAFTLVATSCGGGSGQASQVSVTPPPNPGSSPGTYNVGVTATSGTLVHQITVTLTVQ